MLPDARGPASVRAAWHGLVALVCLCAGVMLAAQHPLWPTAVLLLLCGWTLAAFWRPDCWLLVVPALLPFVNLSPWTGWLACDESDLLLLGCLAAGHARLALHQPAHAHAPAQAAWQRALQLAFGLWLLVSLARGWADAGLPTFDPFEGYAGPMNSLRVGKSALYAMLSLPLVRAAFQRSQRDAVRQLCAGMALGLLGVVLVALWERAAFPGLLEFSDKYRVTAMFWEMHVGGAAIDGYLALAVPFVGWALWSTRRPWQWAAVAVLALAVAYVCLTTYARGVYLAVLGGVLVASALLRMQKTDFDPPSFWRRLHDSVRPARWRSRAGAVLLVGILLEVALVFGLGSFLADRLAASNRDFSGRWDHWARGVALLQTPSDWLLGKGVGRLPVHYAAADRATEFSGAVAWHAGEGGEGSDTTGPFATVRGPATQRKLAGLYALTQRLELVPGAQYRVAFDVRVQAPVELLLQVCERHLLYAGDCQASYVRLAPQPQPPGWQHIERVLQGPPLTGGPVWASRPAMFSVAVVNRGGVANLDNMHLSVPARQDLLANAGFSQGMAHWFPAAQYYFLPWHIDNLYLEWLIERGVVGLLLFGLLMAAALWRLVLGPARSLAVAPYLAASISSGLALGLVSSMMDVPRVAFLLLLLAVCALSLQAEPTVS